MRHFEIRFWLAALLLLACGGVLAADEAKDVLISDSFEKGDDAPEGWKEGLAIPGVKYVYDKRIASEGERCLSLQKTANRYFPIAAWSRVVKHEGGRPVLLVTAKVKAARSAKAIIDVAFLDAKGEWIKHEWVAYIGQKEPGDPVATHDWKTYRGAAEIPNGTQQILIALQMYGPGKVWWDEVQARYIDSIEAAKDAGPEEEKNEENTSPATPSEQDTPSVEEPEPIAVTTAAGASAEYLLIPPSAGIKAPAAGFPLLLVLAGGDGSAEFFPFVSGIQGHALDGRFVVAQLIAPSQIVWPTRSKATAAYSSEEAIAAVIADVSKRHTINASQVHALAWSSGGPAAYAALLQDDSPLAGAFIVMSVFKPDQLPPVKNAAKRRIYLLHSPEDGVCPYWMARNAKEQFASAGSSVTLVEYAGGHGWHGPVFDQIRTGVAWLTQDASQTVTN